MAKGLTFLYMRWVVLLAALTACSNSFAPAGAVPFNPSADFAGLWQQMEQCSGKTGDMNRVQWFQVAKLDTPDGKFHTGWWESPHAIYLTQFDSWIVKHEMLHDLTQSPVHGPIFAACGEM